MSSYFSGFQLDKINSTLNSAAQKTQQKLNDTQEQLFRAIQSINIDETQTILSLKTRTHKLQETLGTIKDISKLPPQYQYLEKKCDTFEKACKRMLIVTKTFEVPGYDYPPNLTESLSNWWDSSTRESFLPFGKKTKHASQKEQDEDKEEENSPPSFPHAIGKAAKESANIIKDLGHESLATGDDNARNEEDEDEDEDVDAVTKMFQSWATSQFKIHKGKQEMDKFVAKEFNKKLEELIEVEFKKVHALRSSVEESRLKFDTLRHEIKTAAASNAGASGEQDKSVDESEDANKSSSEPVSQPAASAEDTELNELLEKYEDEFVSNTSEAVELMLRITDSAKLVTLVKLFHNFQLHYHKLCVREIQSSLDFLGELGVDEE
ncbi:HCL309Wp [Eremothecium sinecaudum]|uniref:HCL309Wp n=1 Tax=Eremothecium sinecaudum TaxID=45286 RepID=A0A109UYV1_9SACH|nr:HCL309Wp [Eremothecium sinecaudum]AMD19842.1 HCL309Wp [Eremothecium sinecaudum]